jgi:DNA-binding IclR family transcriptional regulator
MTQNGPTLNTKKPRQKLAIAGSEEAAHDMGDSVLDAPLVRAQKVLEVVFEATRPLTALEIARRCNLDPSSSHRLVQNLAACGFLIRDDETKRYLPDPRMLFPFPIYHPWELVRRDASSLVMPLRDRLQLTSGFVIFYFGSRVLLELAPGRDPLSPSYRTVLSSPLHASGSGKVFLMAHSEAQRRRILGPGPFEKFTSDTIVDHEALTADLDRGARRGFVSAIDDYMCGFRVVAAPLSVDENVIGCIFCSGGSALFPDQKIDDVGEEVKQIAMLYSRAAPNLRILAQLLGVNGS